MGMIALMLAMQETSAAMPAPIMLEIDFDLAHPPKHKASPEDIVVTGRRRSQRLPPLPDLREDILPPAQVKLGGGVLAVTGEAKPLPGGVTSKRIMLGWKLKF